MFARSASGILFSWRQRVAPHPVPQAERGRNNCPLTSQRTIATAIAGSIFDIQILPISLSQGHGVANSRQQDRGIACGSNGFSLVELLISVLMLTMISAMVYSVLNTGIKFSGKGEARLLALEQQQGLINLLHSQVTSAVYDNKHKKTQILAKDDLLRIVTRYPLLYYDARVVMAFYRYKPDEQALYYMEKKDFYNPEYDDEYLPDFEKMLLLSKTSGEFGLDFDEDSGEVVLNYAGSEYTFKPKCRNENQQ